MYCIAFNEVTISYFKVQKRVKYDKYQIEAIQRRALRIIYSYTNYMPYINALYCASIPSLVDRCEQLSLKFFTSILQPSSCLHILLPTPRGPIITID